jgi:hypothetical protein
VSDHLDQSLSGGATGHDVQLCPAAGGVLEQDRAQTLVDGFGA